MSGKPNKRDEVLKRLLKTPPKPHAPTKEREPSEADQDRLAKNLDKLAKAMGQTDPNEDQ